LVEYTVNEGMAQAQIDALLQFVTGLRRLGDSGFHYTAFETDDPTRFVAVLEFDNEEAKQRFLNSAPFVTYRDGSKDRFPGPPKATPVKLVASTRK